MNRDEPLRGQLKVYFVMGSVNSSKPPLDVLQDAIAGGITMFQFREKGAGALTGEAKLRLAADMRRLCRERGIPFLVNDDIELALAVDADGVHVGQEDETAQSVRSKFGRDKILGVSVHTPEEAAAALEQGADYFGIGPIFPTTTKEDAKAASGTALIRALREKGCDTPIVGIGGITAANAGEVIRAGADGVAVITAISAAPDIRASAAALKAAVYGN
ncbi:thiamine phosphate synthase [Paenibacillus thermotolerans]|uniref:thiamine phosphate synthase n=1 Tax=Paenibacillus thermotolerans TaxID=3027807 RepID=UPI003CC567EF